MAQHRACGRDAARAVPADRLRARPGRFARIPGPGSGHRGHAADASTAVRRSPPRHGAHRVGTHLLPRTRAGSPGGRALITMNTVVSPDVVAPEQDDSTTSEPKSASAFSLRQLV